MIRPLEEAEIGEAAALLVTAFQESPFYRYIAPDDDERREFLTVSFNKRLREGFGVNDMRVFCRDAGENAGGGAIAGIAVWIPPVEDSGGHQAETGFDIFSAPLRRRFFCFLEIMAVAREKAVENNAKGRSVWALAPIAVLPSEQGQGIGGALLRSKLRELDAQKLRCSLATQDKANVPIYEHFGFKTVREDPIAGTELTHYTMLR
jgi:GNAT superfamily N-acetyltransferase